MSRPSQSDYPEYFHRYVQTVKEDDVSEALKNQLPVLENFLSEITEEKSSFSYEAGKWTLKELLQHCIDAERIFNYRALSIARKETAPLPSFDEDLYAKNSDGNLRSWSSLSNEMINLRISTNDLFKSFTDEMLQTGGIAGGKEITVLSLGFIITGHINHHISIVKERYLK